MLDSKLQVEKDEGRRKEKEAEMEAEQKRQDEWMKYLCSTQGLSESRADELTKTWAAAKAGELEGLKVTPRGAYRAAFPGEQQRMKDANEELRKGWERATQRRREAELSEPVL